LGGLDLFGQLAGKDVGGTAIPWIASGSDVVGRQCQSLASFDGTDDHRSDVRRAGERLLTRSTAGI
jgi:hypothetical protein